MKILYLEDNKLDIELTRREFSKIAPDIQMQVVNSVQAAQIIVGNPLTNDLDLVLTDMHLPDGDGLNFLEWIRENGLPFAVVLITGHGDEEMAVAALKSGADDYIAKTPGYLSRLPEVLAGASQRFKAEIARKAKTLSVLYVEHNAADIDLTRRHLARYAPHIHIDILNNAQEVILFYNKPESHDKYDVILLDHRLQGLNAIEVMKELQVFNLKTPIILVTGHGDEEVAVQALKMGAADYVVKSSDYLYHLPSVIENAYNRAKLLQEQEALRSSEERFRRLTENAQDIISRYKVIPEIRCEYISPAVEHILGIKPEEFYQNNQLYAEIIHPDDLHLLIGLSANNGVQGLFTPLILRFRHADGHYVWTEMRNVPVLDDENHLTALESVTRDISDRKASEQRIQQQMERISAMLTIDNAISASLDLNLTLTIVLEHVVSQLQVDAASVLLLDPYTQTLKFFTGRGFQNPVSDNFYMKVGDGFPGRAIMERRIIYSNNKEDFSNPVYFVPEAIKEDFSSAFWIPLISKGVVKAVMEVFSRKVIEADREWMDYLTMLASQTAIAIDNAELFENLQRSNEELLQAYDSTLEGWVHALDLRDKETEGHSKRVAEITIQMANRMGVRPADLEHLRRGALLHDIGKMGVPDAILLKPGPLTEEEWLIMRKHPQFASMLLKPIRYLRKALDIPLYHHERWDGNGYPDGLRGTEIPLAARIFAVIDVWDALISHRPYRTAWSEEDARKYIQDQAGRQFDPEITNEFMKLLDGGIR
jgi:PAS domain S-box-containing protein/putative nucleotidyltransferase with HDIG domain